MIFPAHEGSRDASHDEKCDSVGLSMGEPDSESSQARRHDQRVAAPKLRVCIVKAALFGAREIALCDLLDLSRGGLCVASQGFSARIGQKLDLELYHGDLKFNTRGVVMRSTHADPGAVYGIAFIFAPPELDRLIEAFLADRSQVPIDPSIECAGAEKRQSGNRLATPDAQVYVKRIGSSSPFERCEVDNISQGGLGFYCAKRIASKAPFKVAVQISDSPKAGVISGTVHYMSRTQDQYYYGMEFELISTELARMLDGFCRFDAHSMAV